MKQEYLADYGKQNW